MATVVTLNGNQYSIPAYLDTGWAQGAGNLSLFLAAIPGAVLQKSGGAFTLTADVNFGTSFGIIAKYIISESSGSATAGMLRMAHNDIVAWRNAAGSGNLNLTTNGSDQLTFNGSLVGAGVTSIAGTSNQITASASTGAVTLSLPTTIAVPGVITANVFQTPDTGSGGGVNITSGGSLNLADSTNTGTFQMAYASTNSYIVIMPPSQGDDNSVLINDGSGNLSWGPASNIVQNTTDSSDILVTTSTSFQDSTFGVTITPSSTSSKILVSFPNISLNCIGTPTSLLLTIFRGIGGTNLGGGPLNCLVQIDVLAGSKNFMESISIMDSPNTTSPVTYELYAASDGSQTVRINDDPVLMVAIAQEI